MTLSVYDPIKGCNVLNPDKFIINAFHPDYVKTYMPEFMSSIRTESTQTQNGKKAAKLTPMKMHIVRPKLEPTDFFVYQKAGMPKGVK
jgi:hypothetical protein